MRSDRENDHVLAGSPPSRQQLVAATAFAFIAAAAIVVCAVLPAEYNVDPLGTGKALGLLRPRPVEQKPVMAEGADAFVPVQQGDVAHYAGDYRTDSAEFVIDPYDYVEYKYHLVKGAAMLFGWTASAPVTHEFHGDPDADPNDVHSYDKSTKSGGKGSFVAPVDGIHGWFWENPGNTPITVKLTTAGFYSYAVEIRSNKQRHRHELGGNAPQPASNPEPAR